MRVGYPSAEDEWEMLERRLERQVDEAELTAVVERGELLAMQHAVEQVHVSEGVGRYIVAVVGATRQSPSVEVGASPRGTLALMKLARVKAAFEGRDFVVCQVPVRARNSEERRASLEQRAQIPAA